jgi:hypothetical protein
VRILFDQGTPVPLREALPGHEVETAYERGWSTLKNGELLDVAERNSFDVFVTTDSRLSVSAEPDRSAYRRRLPSFRKLAPYSPSHFFGPFFDRSRFRRNLPRGTASP